MVGGMRRRGERERMLPKACKLDNDEEDENKKKREEKKDKETVGEIENAEEYG